MTDRDAVALATAGYTRRRILAAVIRTHLGRPLPDVDILAPADPGEDLVAWMCRCAGLPEPAAHARQLRAAADRRLAAAARQGQAAMGLDHPDYPPLLRQIPDPPPVLWMRGQPQALSAARMVAIVGARAATRGGLALATDLAAGLAAAGVTVVSGLARGVDGAAHQAAVSQGGASVGVLGSGLDRLYPEEHADLAAAMADQGAVVSEYLADTPALPYHFPQRNRIISGLSAAVVVVEASERSGSLITAMTALEQGREVMAVPGPVGPGRHRGGHALLRDGARLVETAGDILAELGWEERRGDQAGPVPLPAELAGELGLDPDTEDFSTDEVVAATGLPIAAITARFGALELAGRIQRIGGGRFMAVRNRVLT